MQKRKPFNQHRWTAGAAAAAAAAARRKANDRRSASASLLLLSLFSLRVRNLAAFHCHPTTVLLLAFVASAFVVDGAALLCDVRAEKISTSVAHSHRSSAACKKHAEETSTPRERGGGWGGGARGEGRGPAATHCDLRCADNTLGPALIASISPPA